MGFRGGYQAFDRFQRRHAWLGFPLAVRQKYSDDQGGYLAATIAYYGFLSLFPLLLVFVTVLGFALRSHPGLQQQVVTSALAQFPVIGAQLRVHALHGNVTALVVGIVGALWAGMGVALASENAFNTVWGVPFRARPDPLRTRLRALLLLLVLGAATIASAVLSSVVTGAGALGPVARVGGLLLSFALNVGVFLVAFRVLTKAAHSWSLVWVGALSGAVMWQGIQLLGGWYVTHQVQRASDTYGAFATVLGLLAWLYVGAVVVLLAAEVNVVRERRLWPRSFSPILEQPRSRGDERALDQRARVEERRQDQRVEVDFIPDGGAPAEQEDEPKR